MKDISIIILTHNAPEYVEETFQTLWDNTMDEDLSRCEIIVIDNASDEKTKQIITRLKEQGKIDKLFFSTKNTLFAGGNNIGATLASIDSKYYLLMNSDLQIRKKTWLRDLLFFKRKYKASIASYGYCDNPSRSDGFCAIVDKEIYDRSLVSGKKLRVIKKASFDDTLITWPNQLLCPLKETM